jgi:hypothetical protein
MACAAYGAAAEITTQIGHSAASRSACAGAIASAGWMTREQPHRRCINGAMLLSHFTFCAARTLAPCSLSTANRRGASSATPRSSCLAPLDAGWLLARRESIQQL